jgi:hypothetical protein
MIEFIIQLGKVVLVALFVASFIVSVGRSSGAEEKDDESDRKNESCQKGDGR